MKTILPDGLYDILKWIVTIVLPAVAVLIAALAPVWGWADAEKLVLTINAVTAFLGALIGVSCWQYNKNNGLGNG